MSTEAGSDSSSAAASGGAVSLDLLPREVTRRRAVTAVMFTVVVAAAIGGLVGLPGGRLAGLIAAGVVGLPLLVLAVGEFRRRCWLVGGVVSAQALRTRSVDVRRLDRLELLVTEARGTRVVGLLIGGPPKGRTVTVVVASYSGVGGRELDILGLRSLADALASGDDPSGLVFSELLVAQLRAEARDEALAYRPLFRLAALAPGGRVTQRLSADTVTRFVASLD